MTIQNSLLIIPTMTPAEYVIYKFGGVRETARLVGRDHSSVSRWKIRGAVPVDVQVTIIELASVLKIDIQPKDLIFGRDIDGK